MSALGTALGEISRWLDGPGRLRARVAVAAAFPNRPSPERERLIRLAYRHRGRTLATERALARRSDVELCRVLTLDGWERFAAAEARGRGVIAVVTPLGLIAPALRALRLYRGALEASAGTTGRQQLRDHLASGGTVACGLLPGSSGGPEVVVPFYAGELRASTLAGELAGESGAPVLLVVALAAGSGVRLAVDDTASSVGSAEEVTRHLVARLETEVARHPASWPWMAESWRAETPLRSEEAG
jgi:Kdo2-lipid IVA lauroyltransferase/acyltransferase